MLIRQLHNWHSEEMEMDHSAFYGAPWRTPQASPSMNALSH